MPFCRVAETTTDVPIRVPEVDTFESGAPSALAVERASSKNEGLGQGLAQYLLPLFPVIECNLPLN
jgi:hypothetical protein